jgi:hypothetical protein
MSEWLRVSRRTAVVGLALALAGCAGPFADVLMAGTGRGDVSGEVRRVDERNQVIHVGSWLGTSAVRYDRRTRVVYNGREYPVRSLEYGDRVSVAVRRQNRGDLYADRIYVQQSARQAGRHEDRRHARVQYTDGRVHRIDQRQGWFEVRPDRGAAVRVLLPHRASRRQLNDFHRLRRGDWVRVEGVRLQGNRMEMVRII